jgi:hypothetical protein
MVLNTKLALVGLGALFLYILACTSFSPDDSKVLYGTFDAKSRHTAVAVYDRKSGKSELLFEPSGQDTSRAAILRPQWIEDGHCFLTAWRLGYNDPEKAWNLTVLPLNQRGIARTFLLPALGEEGLISFELLPLPVVGSSLFLNCESNGLCRLDLVTGEMHRLTNQQALHLFASPDNDRLFYLRRVDETNLSVECGLLNAETFARTPLFQIKDKNVSALSLALDRDAKRLAYQTEDEKEPIVRLLEAGQPARTLSLASIGQNTQLRIRHFSPSHDILYACFSEIAKETNASFGFVEIPLNGSPIRKTTLISDVEHFKEAKEMEFYAFQIDLSHDGKTLAVDSFWLASLNPSLRAEDCALFLVDLTDAQRKVTKVLIPRPPEEERSSPNAK